MSNKSFATMIGEKIGECIALVICGIQNRTPHNVTIIGANGQEVVTFNPIEPAIRVSTKTEVVDSMAGCIPITETQFGEVENLPEYKEGIFYIVSQIVKNACPDRKDLLVPNETVRDEKGHVKGCRSLGR